MLTKLSNSSRTLGVAALALAIAAPLSAQPIRPVDPDQQINSDLAPSAPAGDPNARPQDAPPPAPPPPDSAPPPPPGPELAPQPAVVGSADTYKEDDLIGAAEGVFGKGAQGVAKMIQGILKKQGQPNGYIVGREAGGAIGVGLRYGSGTLYHKVEGQMPVYWTGPSIGFDAGANAGSTFVLVYNLYNTDDLYKRFPAGEGDAYVIGGLTASYMRKGNVVLIPIRVGAGLRMGVNAGYMKFSKKQTWLPF